jgi:drug/metabolite transporter (DMT)-like permease
MWRRVVVRRRLYNSTIRKGRQFVPDDSRQPYVWMLMGSVCFAVMGLLTNLANESFPWQLVAMTRSIVPFLLVLGWALSAGVEIAIWRPGVLWLRSISGSASLVCTFYALSRLPPSEVFTVTNMFPLWIALLSWPMLGEKPEPGTWISILCGVAGVFVIYPPTFLSHAPTASEWPIVIAVIASVSTAFAMLGLNQLRHIDTRAVVVHFSFLALLFATAAYFAFDRKTPSVPPGGRSLAAILGTGVFAMMGQLFLTKAFTTGQAAKVAVVNLAQIPILIVLQMAFVGYRLDAAKIIGTILVVGPTAWLMLHQEARRIGRSRETSTPAAPKQPGC